MRKYKLDLINKEKNLLEKTEQIKEAIASLNKNKKFWNSFQNVISIELFTISQNYIEIIVEESDVDWHKYIGQKLANKYLMRDYCNPKDNTEMFEWILLENNED